MRAAQSSAQSGAGDNYQFTQSPRVEEVKQEDPVSNGQPTPAAQGQKEHPNKGVRTDVPDIDSEEKTGGYDQRQRPSPNPTGDARGDNQRESSGPGLRGNARRGNHSEPTGPDSGENFSGPLP